MINQKDIKLGLLVVFLFCISLSSIAQDGLIPPLPPPPPDSIDRADEPEVFTVVENMPEFPGGSETMNKFIQKNIVYPDSALKYGITSKVVVLFIIDEKGKVTEAKVVRGGGWGFDEEVLKVINMMPDWKPGMHNGVPVKVRLAIPVRFETRD